MSPNPLRAVIWELDSQIATTTPSPSLHFLPLSSPPLRSPLLREAVFATPTYAFSLSPCSLYFQMQYLDSMNGEDLLLTGEVKWRPLVEKNPQSILKPHTPTYNDEGL